MTDPTSRTAPARARRTAIQKATIAVGVVFLLVGALGFVPGITTDAQQMTFASHHSPAALFGLFQVSVLHNVVHLLFGVVALFAARTPQSSRLYLLISGVIYLALFLYGLVVPMDSPANVVPVNTADNVLHVVLGISLLGVGLALSRRGGAPAERVAR